MKKISINDSIKYYIVIFFFIQCVIAHIFLSLCPVCNSPVTHCCTVYDSRAAYTLSGDVRAMGSSNLLLVLLVPAESNPAINTAQYKETEAPEVSDPHPRCFIQFFFVSFPTDAKHDMLCVSLPLGLPSSWRKLQAAAQTYTFVFLLFETLPPPTPTHTPCHNLEVILNH